MTKYFNSPLENGLRLLLLLEAFGTPQTLDMLYTLDFITIYSKDFQLGTTNLNGDNPYKFSEFASRRAFSFQALQKMVQEGFIEPTLKAQGITYLLTADGQAFSAELESSYANQYRRAAKASAATYGQQPITQLIKSIYKLSGNSFRKESRT